MNEGSAGLQSKLTSGGTSAGAPGIRAAGPTWAWMIATFFGAGRLPRAPGTWGSAAAVLLWFAVTRVVPPTQYAITAMALAALGTLAGIPAATRVARASGVEDPSFVVIDEVVGQLITYIDVPVSWKTLLVGFILFRVFDILKPFPVRRLERLPEGTGIVVDDIGAGIYALIMMHLLFHFRVLS
jgi:phosphatidylglycerophosphatase A